VGLKTGYTRLAGHTLIAAARRNGRTMIAVVLGADDAYGAASRLLDQGFTAPLDAAGRTEQLPGVAFRPFSGQHRHGHDGLPAVASGHRRPAHQGVPWKVPLVVVVVTLALPAAVLARGRHARRWSARRGVTHPNRPRAAPDERSVPVPTVYDYSRDDGIDLRREQELV
jgi:hypothetical protein